MHASVSLYHDLRAGRILAQKNALHGVIPAERFHLLFSVGFVAAIIIYQTPVLNYFPLIVGQVTELHGEFHQAVRLYCVGFNHFRLLPDFSLDIRKEDIIAVCKRQLTVIDKQRQHAPVDQVGAVALGGVLICNVGPSPSSVDVLGKFRSFDRPEFQTSWHRLYDCPKIVPEKGSFLWMRLL